MLVHELQAGDIVFLGPEYMNLDEKDCFLVLKEGHRLRKDGAVVVLILVIRDKIDYIPRKGGSTRYMPAMAELWGGETMVFRNGELVW